MMNNKGNVNLPKITVYEFVEKLSYAYSTIINNNESVTKFPSVMLWSGPGMGKSQGVRQLAESIQKQTGKEVVVTDVRLLLFNPIDLRGIPTSNADKTLAVWLKPKIFDMNPSDDVVNILFLDELSAAPQSVQAAAYQITLDRVVGEHKLPNNCIVIAAGNRVTDKGVAFKMPKPLANRLLHFEIESDFDGWKRWAISHQINDRVISFLTFKTQSLLMNDPTSEDLAFPTPRSWEMVSNILNAVTDDMDFAFPLIAGLVGQAVAIEFMSYLKVYIGLPSAERIFQGRETRTPSSHDQTYALISSLVNYASRHQNDTFGIVNSLKYLKNIPTDFATIMIRDYGYISDEFKDKLYGIPEYLKWIESKGKYLN